MAEQAEMQILQWKSKILNFITKLDLVRTWNENVACAGNYENDKLWSILIFFFFLFLFTNTGNWFGMSECRENLNDYVINKGRSDKN